MPACARIAVPAAGSPYEANTLPRYAIEKAAWVWHPAKRGDEYAVLRFTNTFRLARPAATVIHVSADQRYVLTLDGEELSYGPDRCDVDHRKFASYRVRLTAGPHRLEAVAWWVGAAAPLMQRSLRGGFILAAEGTLGPRLNTGTPGWTVRDVSDAWSFAELPEEVGVDSRIVGCYQTIDGRRWFKPAARPVKPAVLYGPMERSEWYGIRGGWKLEPSGLPDQVRRIIRPGRVIAVIDGGLDSNHPLPAGALAHPGIPAWQALVAGGRPVTVPPRTTLSVLWDLEDYYCAYSRATLSGGSGAGLSMIWAEAFHTQPARRWDKWKGLRTAITGKYFRGLRDTFQNDGGRHRRYEACWWRSGRYVLLTVRTGAAALTVDGVSLRETRYPLKDESTFRTDDLSLAPVADLCRKGIEMCSHETFVDCPHYEQGLYVSDTRIHMLITHALTHDTRLVKSGIEWFDWSRVYNGFTNASYPAGPQLISTFPFYWVLMVRDFAWWRDDPAFIRHLLIGVRANLEEFQRLPRTGGLLHPVPGWAFVDTVPEWYDRLQSPDPRKGPSSILNLLYVYALQNAAELEDAFGDPELAARDRRLAAEIAAIIRKRFWNKRRALVADHLGHADWSEHAQIIALLAGILPARDARACFKALITAADLPRAQENYWMFYLFEVYCKFGRGDLLLAKLDLWKDQVRQGFKAPREMFEPSRSDCHAWASHPLFHCQATLAGIRPAAPGFARVVIAPAPGHLRRIETRLPHPRGWIRAEMTFDGAACRAHVELPAGVTGVFRWKGQERALRGGAQKIVL